MASIKCAHCKETHETVAQVRLCAERERRAKKGGGPAVETPAADPELDKALVTLRGVLISAPTGSQSAIEDGFNEEWARMKREGALREADQEREAYEAEMARDAELQRLDDLAEDRAEARAERMGALAERTYERGVYGP